MKPFRRMVYKKTVQITYVLLLSQPLFFVRK